MKSVPFALLTLVLSATSTAHASKQILPAGSLINCRMSEAKVSSKTEAIGDPVLCQVSSVSRNGPAQLPFNAFLEGRFEDYKDPGHFVGKGWMELKFDRMIVEPGTVIPLSARVVEVPGYFVDREGRIVGKGHRTRDIVEWSIPILWPIDLLNLPRRGPRPTLKTEARLTLKIMDDAEIPTWEEPDRDPSGLIRRDQSGYSDIPQNPVQREPEQQQAYQYRQAYEPPPQAYQYQQPMYQPAPMPVVYVYVQQPPPPVYVYAPPPMAEAAWGRPPVAYYPYGVAYRMPVPYGYGY